MKTIILFIIFLGCLLGDIWISLKSNWNRYELETTLEILAHIAFVGMIIAMFIEF